MRGVHELFGERPEDAKKTDFGRVGFIGGSRDFPNTPAICALASLRAGADLNVIMAPERSADACSVFAPDLITQPLDGDYLAPSMVDRVLEQVDSFSSLVIGNGLGHRPETLEAVEEIVRQTEVPLVLDADALRADIKSLDLDDRKVVLTPHRKEFERLYEEPEGELAAIKEKVTKAARVFGATIVLKGPTDVIANGGDVNAVFAGNPYMTKGGTGDVLAGICGALLARADPIDAGRIAAGIAGTAGDLAADEYRQSFTLEEMMDRIGEAIEELSDPDAGLPSGRRS